VEGEGIIAHYQAEVRKAREAAKNQAQNGTPEPEIGDFGNTDSLAIHEKTVDSAVAGLVFALREEDAGAVRAHHNNELMDWKS
jgi:hypothetical protein